MARSLKLRGEDRRYFGRVVDAVFTNPFAERRAELISEINRGTEQKPSPDVHHLKTLVPTLRRRLGRFEPGRAGIVRRFAGEDRALVANACLFLVYQQNLDRLDRIIEDQKKQPADTVPVPFWKEVFEELSRLGFTEAECGRSFSLFFQLRRAYFFIVRSLVGSSPCMRRLRHALWNNVFTPDVLTYERHLWNRMEDFSTLLLGETGTGKGTAAAAIGRSGYIPFDERRGCFAESFAETFVSINLAQYPESLIESELFGHRKGAFTGAVDRHRGLFERCSEYGSLFIDEIGEVSIPIQIKLLQVLQERTFSPVGGHERKRFSGRVIAATNVPLAALRKEGRLRDDFYYRLCSDVITVPPLRQRLREDSRELERLAALLLKRMTGGESEDLRGRILDALNQGVPAEYAWPGNVRELEQAIRRILLTGRYEGEGERREVSEETRLLEMLKGGTMTAQELMGRYCHLLYEKWGTYLEVSRRIGLDRRTVRKYVEEARRTCEPG